MKKKILSLSLPAGLLTAFIYFIGDRFFIEFQDVVAYPVMIVSIGLMLTGIAYNGYCFGKHKNS